MVKRSRSLQKADAYMEPEPTSTMVPFLSIYLTDYYFRNISSVTDLQRPS